MKPLEREAFYNELVSAMGAGDITWGQAVRALRVEVAGVNQATFAQMTRISERTLRHLESDSGNPTLATLSAVFSPFGLELTLQRKQRPL